MRKKGAEVHLLQLAAARLRKNEDFQPFLEIIVEEKISENPRPVKVDSIYNSAFLLINWLSMEFDIR